MLTPDSSMKWTLLESEYLSRRPWMTARRDRVQLPSGVVQPEYYVLEYPTWINIIAITRDGRFVMVEQYRHGLQEVFFEICAGVAEEGEEPLDAARRELAEETGYTGGEWELNTVICANPSSQNNLSYCYIARDVELTEGQHLDSTEDIRVHLFTEAEVLELLRTDRIKQALMAATLWKYFYNRATGDCK